MARRPTLGIGGPSTQVRPIVAGAAAGRAATAERFADAFGRLHLQTKPIAMQESAVRGLTEAQEAIDRGEPITPRSEFFTSGRAFNQTAARVLATRTATDAQVQIDDLVRKKGHDPAALSAGLNALKAGYIRESAMASFPGLRAEFEELFERQRGVAVRQAGEISAQLLADQDLAAAQQAITAYEQGIQQMAIRGATPEEMAGQAAQYQDLLIQFGPRGEFELNGQKYLADEGRSGALSLQQIQRAIIGVADNVEVLSIQGQFERTNAKGSFARRFRQQLLDGTAKVDPAKGLALLNSMEAEVRSLNAEARARRSEARTELRAAISLLEKGRELGAPATVDWEAMKAKAGGDPQLLAEISAEQYATEQVLAARPMSLPERQAHIETLRARAQRAAEAGGVDVGALAAQQQLQAEAQRMLTAITEETTGLQAAEDAYAATATLTSPEDFAAIRERAAGNPDILAKIDRLETSQRAIADARSMTPLQRREFIDELEAFVADGAGTIEAQRKITAAISAVEKDNERLAKITAESPADAAAMQGRPVAPLDTSSPAAAAGTIIARQPVISDVASTVGADPKLLRPQEVQALDTAMRAWSASDRLAFVAAIGQLPERERLALEGQLANVQGGIGHVSAVAAGGNADAAGLALRGAELRAAKVGTAPSEEIKRAARFNLGLDDIPMDPAARAGLEQFAENYAIGKANGGEVTPAMIEEGLQAAMMRQPDGTGGLVRSSFGYMILPAGLDESTAEDLIETVTAEELQAMNGGQPLLDASGQPVTPEDVAEAEVRNLEPGKYLLELRGGGGVVGIGPGGNFVLDLTQLAAKRGRDTRAAQPALTRDIVRELDRDQAEQARRIQEFEALQQSREDFRNSLIEGGR